MSECGIIGPPGDEQVARVRACLKARGADPVVLDLSRFPADHTLSLLDGVPWQPDPDPCLSRVRSWYVRSFPLPLPFYLGDPARPRPPGERAARYASGRERRSFGYSFVQALHHRGAVMANVPATFTQHFLKLDQLHLLRGAGVPVPRTLAGNDPRAVREFARAVGGPIVYKPLAGGALCRRVTPADLRQDRLRLLAAAPVLFQEEVPGANLRVYVVAGRVTAAYEIVSDRLDYRGAETAVHPATLSPAERRACLTATRACGMTFTGIDLRRRPDGTFAVLECNPSPMFAAVERRTGTRAVTEALAGLLLAAR